MRYTQIPWVIIQAGGKGSRLRSLTQNKPKCLLPVYGKPLLYHVFDVHPQSNFIIIGDYLYEILEKYCHTFPPPVSFKLIKAAGKGTLSGLKDALIHIPEDQPFLYIWCDLLFQKIPDFEVVDNMIALSQTFKCRWSYTLQGQFVEESSAKRGVMGIFIFKSKTEISNVPEEGEWVRWLSNQNLQFNEFFLHEVYELGTIDAVEALQQNQPITRFFNKIEFLEDRVIKTSQLKDYDYLIEKEIAWYQKASELGITHIPTLLSRNPLTLERIQGVHPFEMDADERYKEYVLTQIFESFDKLHNAHSIAGSLEICQEVYLDKTVQRVKSVSGLIPGFTQPELKINDVWCKNPFHEKNYSQFVELIASILSKNKFCFIHGDPTFSNLLIDACGKSWFIDPRGHFGRSNFYGDPLYDWSKLYYSIVGNYDQFNCRNFKLSVYKEYEVNLEIQSNDWSFLEHLFVEKVQFNIGIIKIIHVLIWFSLCGYVKDDVDSILGAFYQGALLLEKECG